MICGKLGQCDLGWEEVENRDLADQGEHAEREKRGEVGEESCMHQNCLVVFCFQFHFKTMIPESFDDCYCRVFSDPNRTRPEPCLGQTTKMKRICPFVDGVYSCISYAKTKCCLINLTEVTLAEGND